MKINRVLLSSNNNNLYYGFWNPLSKVYLEKFNIRPTLIWVGTEEEKNDCNISDEYGDILIVEPNKNYETNSQCTLATYWATQFFPNDICFICGIDEVPLSNIFIKDMIKDYPDDSYIMLIADAYNPNHWSIVDGTSPSGQHISKGENFLKIYQFEKTFKDEVDKIYSSDTLQKFLKSEYKSGYRLENYNWGIDESYFSYKLRNYSGDIKIFSLNNFGLMVQRRIECNRHNEPTYDIQKLKSGWYSQAHLCRPFEKHKNYILNLYDNINYYN